MLSLVIPTFGREQVLVDTIAALEPQRRALASPSELLVVDQTPRHQPAVQAALEAWQRAGRLRWLRLNRPHLTRAMNTGLLQACGDTVLFLDDDIVPAPGLLQAHLQAHRRHLQAWAVVGQVLQPGQQPQPLPPRASRGELWRDLDFPFNSSLSAWIENAMAGNLSLKRDRALAIGGFDERFPPPVAARFETEFAKRLIAAGGHPFGCALKSPTQNACLLPTLAWHCGQLCASCMVAPGSLGGRRGVAWRRARGVEARGARHGGARHRTGLAHPLRDGQ